MILLALLVLAPGPTLADNCMDRLQQLAAAYDIATDPPTIPPGEMRKPISPDDLARSGGVVEPPPVRDPAVITPPRDHSGMPTMPDITPSQPKRTETEKTARAQKLGPEDMSTLQALLVAARSQAERGMESECLDGLRKAQELIARKPAGG
jgi:hypothetical protein